MRPTNAATPIAELEGNIESIMRLEQKALLSRSPGERIAAAVAAAAGSTPSVIAHVLWFGGWIAVNSELIPGVIPFDPFPFTFLGFISALEAIFLALIVLMSQKRIIKEADKRAHLDLQINLLAEQESTMTLKMVRSICKHLGLQEEEVEKAEQLQRPTDVNQVAKKLDKKMPG